MMNKAVSFGAQGPLWQIHTDCTGLRVDLYSMSHPQYSVSNPSQFGMQPHFIWQSINTNHVHIFCHFFVTNAFYWQDVGLARRF
jgi:hypothetical protein